jgi:predicted AlkP superfamily phosphohydrolase/phosphomutase
MTPKVIILGLDGLDPEFVAKGVNDNSLPSFRQLMNKGCFGRLKSTIPPITIPAWPAMLTGMTPGKLGVFDFRVKTGAQEFSYVSSQMFKGQMLWDIVSENGLEVGVIEFPVTTPWEINGFMISGLVPKKLKQIYPSNLQDEVESILARMSKTFVEISHVGISDEKKRESIMSNTEIKFELLRELAERKKWDLLISVMFAADEIMHHTVDERDLHTIYQKLDEEIASILDYCIAKKCYLFIVSDHGCKKTVRELSINTWLEKEGFLFIKRKQTTSFDKFLLRTVNYLMKKGYRSFLRSTARIFARLIGKDITRSRVSGQILEKIDWTKTQLYGYTVSGSSFMGLWLNRSRYSESVPEETMKADLNPVIKRLVELNDPDTGQKIISHIHYRSEIYHGPHLDSLPDLVIEAAPEYAIVSGLYPWVIGHSESFIHALFGTLIAYGPDIIKGKRVEANIQDIASTILHIMNLPLPPTMDGQVLKDLFEPNSELYQKPVKYSKKRVARSIGSRIDSEAETKALEERLRGLGYL